MEMLQILDLTCWVSGSGSAAGAGGARKGGLKGPCWCLGLVSNGDLTGPP